MEENSARACFGLTSIIIIPSFQLDDEIRRLQHYESSSIPGRNMFFFSFQFRYGIQGIDSVQKRRQTKEVKHSKKEKRLRLVSQLSSGSDDKTKTKNKAAIHFPFFRLDIFSNFIGKP